MTGGHEGPGMTGALPVVLSLGSNQGDSLALLQQALDALAATDGLHLDAVSGVHATAPMGPVTDQPDFRNIVVLGTTTLDGRALLDACHRVEDALGRRRTIPGGPRTLDVDVVALGDLASDDPVLTLPHPRAHERAFVLLPWLEADPDAVLPGHGRVDALATRVADQRVEPTGERLVLR